eukprot:TRINITY_DN3944_c0_g1_i1.p1 TRINITY_DN3944_c0_g1~~TRINITY_DN3944_c0_g1_i1.p1  ORF type:complete len:128 (-),score=10.49 TRINITY_DN3944_c0_g1_i1:162-545(-)
MESRVARCPAQAVPSAVIGAAGGGGISAFQGGDIARSALIWGGAMFSYNSLTCAIGDIRGGRPRAIDNVLAGGILGGIGVQQGLLGIPLLPSDIIHQYSRVIPRTAQGAAMYGLICGGLAMLQGRPL